MINIKVILLLSLAACVSCVGDSDSPTKDSAVERISENADNKASSLTSESRETLNEEQSTREDSNDGVCEEALPTSSEVQDQPINAATQEHGGRTDNSSTISANKIYNFSGGKLTVQERGGGTTTLNSSGTIVHPLSRTISVGGGKTIQETYRGVIAEGTPAKSLDGDNSECGEPSGLPNEDNPISEKVDDEVEEKEIVVDVEEKGEEEDEVYDDVEEELDEMYDAIYDTLYIDATGELHSSAELQEEEPINAATRGAQHGGRTVDTIITGVNTIYNYDGRGNLITQEDGANQTFNFSGGKLTIRERGGGSTTLDSSGTNVDPLTRTISVSGGQTVQETYRGVIAETNDEVKGKIVTIRGKKLLIDNVEYGDVDASARPIHIQWKNNILVVKNTVGEYTFPSGPTGEGYICK